MIFVVANFVRLIVLTFFAILYVGANSVRPFSFIEKIIIGQILYRGIPLMFHVEH